MQFQFSIKPIKTLLNILLDTKYLDTQKSSREQKQSITVRLKCCAGAQLISIHPQDKQGNSITMIDAIIYDNKDNDTTSAAELAAAAALTLARVVVQAVEKKEAINCDGNVDDDDDDNDDDNDTI